MEWERLSRRLLTHLIDAFCFVRITPLLLLLCCSKINVVCAQSTTVVAPLRQQKSWIVGHGGSSSINTTSTQSVVPGCTDLCLNALSPNYDATLVGLSVQMYPCQDNDNSLFQYNDSSNAITMWDPAFQVNRCLDAGQFPPSNTSDSLFTLQQCNVTAANQQWYFQAGGQIRSGLVNSSSESASQSTQFLYMQGNSRQPGDWGKGWNTFGLFLSSTGGNSSTISSFSLLPYASPPPVSQLPVAPPPHQLASNGRSADWIMNGGFERFGYDPGQNSLADFSSDTWWFIVCSWAITSGSVQLSGSSPSQDEQNGSSNATMLHMNGNNGPGAITQLFSTDAGWNYSLSFDFAGNSTPSCGSNMKTFNVSVSPSDRPLSSFSFNVSNEPPASLGWISAPELNFTAYGTSINLTFQSTTDGVCGPLVNNVAVRRLQSSVPRVKQAGNSALSSLLKVIVAVLAAGLLIPTLFCCFWVWKNKHRRASDINLTKEIRCKSKTDSLRSVDFSTRTGSFTGGYGTHYSWEELETATNNFAKVIDLGDSGSLYLAEFPDGLLGSVEVDGHQRQWTSGEAFKQEVAILRRLHHSYLVNFIAVCLGEGSRRALVFEYMPNGNLFDRLHKLQDREPLAWQVRMVIAYQVACALEYLHEEASPPIIHPDVRAANVLLQKDDSAKLAAFHVSRTGRTSCKLSSFDSSSGDLAAAVKKGAYGYQDPAFHRTGRISKKSNVYSYGALLLELITGLPAPELESIEMPCEDFLTNTEETAVNLVDPKLLGKFNQHELVEVLEIVVKCLKPQGKSRPSMSDVVFMLRAGFSSSRPLLYP